MTPTIGPRRIPSGALLRLMAAALAVTAVADPSCTREHDAPISVVVRRGSADAADDQLADRVRQALAAALPERIDLDSPEPPAAMVLAGNVPEIEEVPEGIPVSVVTRTPAGRRNVRISQIGSSRPMLPGWTGRVRAIVLATQAVGETSLITLEQDSIELGRIEHTWRAADERFEAGFDYIPAAPGVRPVRVRVGPLDGESTVADNHADTLIAVEDRTLEVLVYEPRPSWTTTFIRRALEDEPIFEIAGIARPSRGIEVTTGAAPPRLRPDTIEQFDVIIVGAPEELRQEEIDALSWFARVRGGTFILAPDRRPSGGYLQMIPAVSFEEKLLESPAVVHAPGTRLRAAEFAIPVKPGPAVDTIGALDREGRNDPVVIKWPAGSGQGLFIGALDAWRHRGRGDEFSSFWRAHAAAAAAGSPHRVEAALAPAVASPGGSVTLTTRIRGTESEQQESSIRFPVVSARVVHADGSAVPIRLWPTAEAGVFEGRFDAPDEGNHIVQVSSGEVTVDTPFVVTAGARSAHPGSPASAELLAASTGGVAVTPDDLSPLIAQLERMASHSAPAPVHPSRSLWWSIAFGLLLCAEWGIRRRRGQR